MHRLTRLFIPLLFFIGVIGPVVTYSAPVFAADNILEGACSSGDTADSPTCENTSPDKNPLTGADGMLIRVTHFIALIAGVTAVIIIIISGIRYITSGGDTQKAVGARNALIGALVGLVIIGLADVIIVAIIRGFL